MGLGRPQFAAWGPAGLASSARGRLGEVDWPALRASRPRESRVAVADGRSPSVAPTPEQACLGLPGWHCPTISCIHLIFGSGASS
jgi:hypothetical protein